MKKKIALFALLTAMSLSLMACGGKKEENTSSESSTAVSVSETASESDSQADAQESSSSAGAAPEAGTLTKEQVIDKMKAYYGDSKAVRLDMEMNMGRTSKQSIVVDAHQNMHMTMDIAEGMTAEMYVMKDGDSSVTYMSMDGGATFTKQAESGLAVSSFQSKGNSYSLFAQFLDMSVEGANYVFSGNVNLEEIANSPEMKDAFSSALNGSSLNILNGSIPMHVVVDGTDFHITEFTMDMTEMMQAAMKEMAKSQSSAEALDLSGMQFKIITRDIVVNGIEDIVLPEAAKAASELKPAN
ncbi:MAG: hypothetical protein SOR89_04880 [Ndongobacter sp.]|nr:hypothetical protein [Ndongobacter sp.]